MGAWQQIGASREVSGWIWEGVKPEWLEGALSAPFDHGNSIIPAELKGEWDLLKKRYMVAGAMHLVRFRTHVSRTFLRGKRNNGKIIGWRLCVDLHHLNQSIKKRPVRYESLTQFTPTLEPKDSLVLWDLCDALFYLRIKSSHIRYFTARVDGQILEFPALMFGYVNSLAVFTKLMRLVVAFLRAPQYAVLICLKNVNLADVLE